MGGNCGRMAGEVGLALRRRREGLTSMSFRQFTG